MCHHPEALQECVRESRGRIGAMQKTANRSESQAYFCRWENRRLHYNMRNGVYLDSSMTAHLSLVAPSEAGKPFDTWQCKHRPRGGRVALYALGALCQIHKSPELMPHCREVGSTLLSYYNS